MKKITITFQKSVCLLLALLCLIGMLPILPTHASPSTLPIQLDLTQLASNGNGKVTFQILNPPSGFDFSSLTAAASWDNSNWVYAIWYEGGCPTACVVEWPGQTATLFYIKLANQVTSIIFNQAVSPIPNAPPSVTIPTPISMNNSGIYSATGFFTDTDSTSWTATVDYGDGSGVQNLPLSPNNTFNLSNQYTAVGTYTITVNVTDNQGATGMAAATLVVPFNFAGFFQPVDNLPTLNVMHAGRGVAVKFSLSGYQGLNILANGYPTSSIVECGATAEDAIEQTLTVGSGSLTYDGTTDQYTYSWKTDKAWAGICRTLIIKLSDGTYHRANFKFK
jgi:hypothetical protein